MQDNKILKVTRTPQGDHYVPGFRIAGKWLQNLGFDYGDQCRITPQPDGSLLIAKVQEVKNER